MWIGWILTSAVFLALYDLAKKASVKGNAIGRCDEVIIGGMEQAERFQSEIVGIRAVSRKSVWYASEHVVLIERELMCGSLTYYGIEVALAVADVFAQHLDNLWIIAVITCGEHVLIRVALPHSGSDMEIIAGIARLLASGTYVCTHVGLVRALVLRETHVAVYAVRTVLRGKSAYG